MAKNIFGTKRVAFGNLTIPSSNSTTISSGSSVYIPKGSIITAVKVMAGDSVALSPLANCTFNIYVGSLAIGSNNNICSGKIVQTVPGDIGLASSAGVYVSVGGNLIVHLGSGTSTTGGLVGDFDIYVDYLYCADRDDA